MLSKCIEPVCAASSTSPVAVLVLVEIDFPGSLRGKPKLDFRLVSGECIRNVAPTLTLSFT